MLASTCLYSLYAWFIDYVNEGPTLFDIDDATQHPDIPKANMHYTMVFTALISMTLFNELNSRKVHGERNFFRGILNNYIFIGIWVSTFFLTVSERPSQYDMICKR